MATGNSGAMAWLPWRDTRGEFSWLRAVVFALMFVPFIWMVERYISGDWDFPSPYVPLVYHSGVWATVLLMLALTVTPMRSILRAGRLIQVRRMIGLGALAYTLFHILCWFALRDWDFPALWNETITRISLIVATLSTLGMIALGITSTDGAVRSMGANLWRRMHRHVYWVTALAILHYMFSPRAAYDGLPFILLGIYFWLMAWRWMARSRGRGTNPVALVALAFGAAFVTLIVQPIWLPLVHPETNEKSAWTIVTDSFSAATWNNLVQWGIVDIGVSMWAVLALGLFVALITFVVNRLSGSTKRA